MILPEGYESMSDAELRAALLELGYDKAGADSVIAMVRAEGSEGFS